MKYEYKPKGVCSRLIEIELEKGIIKEVHFVGGCSGNLQGIGSLVQGQRAKDVIEKVRGIQCGVKPTSCPDQLADALEAALKEESVK